MGTCGSIPKVKEGNPHYNIINGIGKEGKESKNDDKGEEGRERKESKISINDKGKEGKDSKNIINVKGDENKKSNNIIIQYREKALRIHNEYRIKHNSPELKMNEKLNEMAENYANLLLDSEGKKAFPLNIYEYGSILGENIMISTKKTVEEMCEAWHNERKNYDYNLNNFQKGTGHFTQLIWKETKEVGFGFIFKDNNFCGVAYYYPAGNILGEFSENISSCK